MDTPLYEDGDVEAPLPPDAEYEDNDYNDYNDYVPPTSILRLAFPENYTWQLEFGAGGEVVHQIHHPQVYAGGREIAEEGANFELPGLRWAELKQMVDLLLATGLVSSFDPHTLYPLLYPIVDPVTLAEYDEVRQTLRTAGKPCGSCPQRSLSHGHARINVFEKGRLLHHDTRGVVRS